jgi:hypothetical protein
MLTANSVESVERAEPVGLPAAVPAPWAPRAGRFLRVAAWSALWVVIVVCLEYLTSWLLRTAFVEVLRDLILSRLGSAR